MRKSGMGENFFCFSGGIALLFCLILLCGQCVFSKETGVREIFVKHIENLKIEKGKSKKNVVIFPLVGKELLNGRHILTLDEAMEKGGLLVKELEPEDVNRIMVQNKSSERVFIMAGEILTGSKQDRILKDDLLLPSRSGNIVVNAYCVERGRWTYKSKSFSSNKTASNISVRQKARETSSQGSVWSAVSETQSAAGCASDTSALNDTYKAPEVKRNIDDLYEEFRNLPEQHPSMNGVAVVIGDEILCADLFGSSELFNRLWPKLLKSYLLEALSKGGGHSPDMSTKDIREYLAYVGDSTIKSSDAPGEGVVLKIESSWITGSALTFENDLVHCDIFPHSSGKKHVDEVQPIQRRY